MLLDCFPYAQLQPERTLALRDTKWNSSTLLNCKFLSSSYNNAAPFLYPTALFFEEDFIDIYYSCPTTPLLLDL